MKKHTHQSFTPEELDALLARHVLELPLHASRSRVARLVGWGALFTVGDACRIDEEQFLNFRDIGEVTLAHVVEALDDLGLARVVRYPEGPFEAKARAGFLAITEMGLNEGVLEQLLVKGFYSPDSLIDPKSRRAVTSCLVHGLPPGERYLSRETEGPREVLETPEKRYKDLLVRVRKLKKR